VLIISLISNLIAGSLRVKSVEIGFAKHLDNQECTIGHTRHRTGTNNWKTHAHNTKHEQHKPEKNKTHVFAKGKQCMLLKGHPKCYSDTSVL
jgi:hypothetical protein